MNATRTSLSAALALAVAMGIGRFAFTPMLPLMQDDGLSVAQGGWLASANYLGYFAGALTAALLSRERVVIVSGLLSIAAVTAAMGWTHDFSAWVSLRFLAGLLSAWVLVHAASWSLRRLAAAGRPALSGLVFGGVGAGIALAGLLCAASMRAGVAADPAWLVLGTAALVLSIAALPGLREPAVPRKPRPNRRTAGSTLLVACYGAYGFGYILPATFLPAMARHAVADPSVFGWTWPAFGIAGMLSTVLAARLRTSNRTLWAGSHFIMALGVALPVVSGSMAAILFSALAVGGTFMVVTMAAIGEAESTGGGTRLVAAMTAAFAAGQLAGPLVVSSLGLDERGFAGPLLAAAALLVVSGLALLVSSSQEKTHEALSQ